MTVKEFLEQKQSTYDSLEWQKYAGIHTLFRDAAVVLNMEFNMFDEHRMIPSDQKFAEWRPTHQCRLRSG